MLSPHSVVTVSDCQACMHRPVLCAYMCKPIVFHDALGLTLVLGADLETEIQVAQIRNCYSLSQQVMWAPDTQEYPQYTSFSLPSLLWTSPLLSLESRYFVVSMARIVLWLLGTKGNIPVNSMLPEIFIKNAHSQAGDVAQ